MSNKSYVRFKFCKRNIVSLLIKVMFCAFVISSVILLKSCFSVSSSLTISRLVVNLRVFNLFNFLGEESREMILLFYKL